MINNNNTNNQDQGNGESEDSRQRSSLSFGLQQGAFLASLLGPIQMDTPATANAESTNQLSNPSMMRTSNAPAESSVQVAAASASASDPLQSMLFGGRFEPQDLQASQHLNADMGGFDMAASLQNQNPSQNESIPRLFSQPKQNMTNDNQIFGGMNNNAMAAAGSEFRAFFGSDNVPNLGGGMQSSTNSSARRLSVPIDSMQGNPSGSSAGLLGQQNANIHALSGNLPVQNTLNYNNAISFTAQDTLRSQMSLHTALNTSWQRQSQQHPLQLQQQLQQPQSLQQQQQQLRQQLQLQQQLHQPLPTSSVQQLDQLDEAPWSDAASLEGPPQLPPEIKWKGRGRSSTFPLKLHQMLLDLEKQEGGTAIASFLPHGRGFQIHKPKEFSKEIMPNYFRMSTYSSFQRQLNLYDFQRIAEGPEKGAYWHELFIRDQPMLSTNMKRSKVKGATRAKQDERLKKYEQEKDRFGR